MKDKAELTFDQARSLRALVDSEVGIQAIEEIVKFEISQKQSELLAAVQSEKFYSAAGWAAEIQLLTTLPALIVQYAEAGYRRTPV